MIALSQNNHSFGVPSPGKDSMNISRYPTMPSEGSLDYNYPTVQKRTQNQQHSKHKTSKKKNNKSNKKRQRNKQDSTLLSIFLSCLPNKTKEKDLRNKYSQIGEIVEIIVWNRGTFQNCTYAVLKTYSRKLYNYLLNQDQYIFNDLFYTRIYYSKKEKEKYVEDLESRRLGISNIPPECSD